MKLLFLSHTAMGGPFVVGSHQLARAFSRSGHDVSHVSVPISPVHVGLALRDPFVRERCRRWLRGGRCFDQVTDMVPFTWLPWALARVSPALMRAYSNLMLMTPARTAGGAGIFESDYVIVDDPRFVGVVERFASAKLIYRATDLYAEMRNDSKILDAERAICANASLLVATSVRVAEHLQRLSGKAVQVLTNGVDFDHFAQPAPLAAELDSRLPGRRQDRAVYVGAFDERFGSEALKRAAAQLPDKTFILVGPGSKEHAAGLSASNVFGLGAMRYEDLPGMLQRCAVGILPMSAHASNEGRSPMKFYEYAAAGLCVAASTTHELRRRELPTLFLAGRDDDFPTAAARAFESSKDRQRCAEARAIAKAQSWEGKAELLLELIRARGEHPDAGSRIAAGLAAPSAVAAARMH